MNELLKEARDWISDAEVHHGGMRIQQDILLRRIDAALTTPEYSPDSMELVLKIREKNPEYPTEYNLWPQDAARLLDDWRAMPMAMLDEYASLYFQSYDLRIDRDGLQKRTMNEIAAKYGHKIKE